MADVVFTSCEDGAGYRTGEYFVYNSMWGKEDAGIEPYSQCIDVYAADPTDVSMRWYWNWPVGGGHVKGYPAIHYGHSPYHAFTTTPQLPVLLSRIGGIEIAFDTTPTATPDAKYNTAFDLWITADNPPTPEGVRTEIMIWVNCPNWGLYKVDGRVTIDGQDYDYLIEERGQTRYIGFQRVIPEVVGTIHIDRFLNYLLSISLVSGNNYLAEICFGTEQITGQADTTVNHYSIVYTEREMELLLELQNILIEIETQLSALQTQSDSEAAKILMAQQVKAQADASIVVYDQVKQKCQEMIVLLTP